MRRFENNIGCVLEFDDELSDEVIQARLEFFGEGFKEVVKMVENERDL